MNLCRQHNLIFDKTAKYCLSSIIITCNKVCVNSKQKNDISSKIKLLQRNLYAVIKAELDVPMCNEGMSNLEYTK